jgi:hypothetical protein
VAAVPPEGDTDRGARFEIRGVERAD